MKWIAYGLNINDIIFETEHYEIKEAVKYCKDNDIDFDTVEVYDDVFTRRYRKQTNVSEEETK